MISSDEIQALIAEEIEALANACRAYKPRQAPDIHTNITFSQLLDELAGIPPAANAA